MLRKNQKLHNTKECSYRNIKCNLCEKKIKYREIQYHSEYKCEKNVISCIKCKKEK